MPEHELRYLANCSMLFTEHPLLQRPQAAKDAGFDAIEFWWPWPEQPDPGDAEVDAFVSAVSDAGVQLVGLNFFAGDLAGPDCGVLSIPDRSAQFVENLPVAVGIGERLGVSAFNALYGNRVQGSTPEEQDRLGREMLGRAADAAEAIGATVLVEPVSGPKPYPLRTAADAVAVVKAVRDAGHANVGFLCDLFHLANNGDDVAAAIAAHADLTAHVQIADWPGPRRTRQRRARPRRPARRPRRTRVRRVGRPGVQADVHHRGRPRVAARARRGADQPAR